MHGLKNYQASCERNKEPILQQLRNELTDCGTVLEIGSGSGQHALYFGAQLPHLHWQTTELPNQIAALRENLRTVLIPNLPPPIVLDVTQHPWAVEPVSAIFSANTLHIMAWNQVENFFKGVGQTLRAGGKLCIYGPFRYHDEYTSESNATFDQWLKKRDPKSGIRDFEAVEQLARTENLKLRADHQMPSNNQLLVWQAS